ncbi:MAG: hypothetical protein AAF394_17295 [Planctomycetota bacterium]
MMEIQSRLRAELFEQLRNARDPRVAGGNVLWDFYSYYGLRRNKEWW